MFQTITTPQELENATQALGHKHPCFSKVLPQISPLSLRRRPAGFEGVLSAIVSQQISTAAARTIWKRFEAAGLTQPAVLCAAPEQDLRAVGLSRQKARYVQALAAANIDFDAMTHQSEEEVVMTLTAVPGIGRWSAQMYLIFALGRADVFAPGDLALQEGARVLLGLNARPTERELHAIAEEWRPWRSVAAQIIWAYYGIIKKREGVM